MDEDLSIRISTHISTMPCLPVVVGGRQGLMHNHSHSMTPIMSCTLSHMQLTKTFKVLFTIRTASNNLLDEYSGWLVAWRSSSTFPTNPSQWPFIRVCTYVIKFFLQRMPPMSHSLVMWSATCLRIAGERLPGGCRNWPVPQFNPPYRQELPMRREFVWHQHLSPSIWKNSPVTTAW